MVPGDYYKSERDARVRAQPSLAFFRHAGSIVTSHTQIDADDGPADLLSGERIGRAEERQEGCTHEQSSSEASERAWMRAWMRA